MAATLVTGFGCKQDSLGITLISSTNFSIMCDLYPLASNLSVRILDCVRKLDSLEQFLFTLIIGPLGMFLIQRGSWPLVVGKYLFLSVGLKKTFVSSFESRGYILTSKKIISVL